MEDDEILVGRRWFVFIEVFFFDGGNGSGDGDGEIGRSAKVSAGDVEPHNREHHITAFLIAANIYVGDEAQRRIR